MPRTATQQVRVHAPSFIAALKAAKAFVDDGKKSHRNRINIRSIDYATLVPPKDGETSEWPDGMLEESHNELVVAGGAPTRAIVVYAGHLDKGDFLEIDLPTGSVARIAALFNSTAEIDLKSDGKLLKITAADAMFDNHCLELRIKPTSKAADTVAIACRIEMIGSQVDALPDSVAITADTSTRIAAAAKALDANSSREPVSIGDTLGVKVLFGRSAVAWVRGYSVGEAGARKWNDALVDTLPDEWTADGITLQHLLDGALPTKASVTVIAGADDAVDAPETEALSDRSDPGITVFEDDEAKEAVAV